MEMLKPKITVPMHYWYAMTVLDRFTSGPTPTKFLNTNKFTVSRETLPAVPEIYVLKVVREEISKGHERCESENEDKERRATHSVFLQWRSSYGLLLCHPRLSPLAEIRILRKRTPLSSGRWRPQAL